MVSRSAAMIQTSTLVLLVHLKPFTLVLPSLPARPGGGLAHAFHDRSLRRIHALLDAVARTADQRECEDNDRQDAQMLIPRPVSIQPQPAVDGKGESARAPKRS